MNDTSPQEPTFDLADPTLFGAEAAEAETDPRVFMSYFYETLEFGDFADPSKHFVIANAYKGEGKSAFLRAVEEGTAATPDSIVIRLSSADLDVPDQGENYDAWMRSWRRALVNAIGLKIGRSIKVAWTEDDIVAVEQSERQGLRERNVIGLILDRLQFKVKQGPAEAELTSGSSAISEHSVQRMAKDRAIWLLVDEADVNFINSNTGRHKVAGLLTACRKLCQSVTSLRIRTTVRPTTWTALYSRIEDMTHVRDALLPLQWQTQDIRNILAKRIEAYLIRTGQSEFTRRPSKRRLRDEELVALVFPGTWQWAKRTDSDDGQRPPHVALSNLCRDRPRWLIELCKEAAKRARRRDSDAISKNDVIDCLADFGNLRILDLQSEFATECQSIEQMINGFNGQLESYKTDELLTLIKNRVADHVDVRIAYENGRCTPMQIAHFLFRVGFLTARHEDGPNAYEHFAYAQKPSLLRDPSNPDQGCSWEIHPIYRQALGIRDSFGIEIRRQSGARGKERR